MKSSKSYLIVSCCIHTRLLWFALREQEAPSFLSHCFALLYSTPHLFSSWFNSLLSPPPHTHTHLSVEDSAAVEVKRASAEQV